MQQNLVYKKTDKKVDLASLKPEVDKLDMDILKAAPTDLLSNVS